MKNLSDLANRLIDLAQAGLTALAVVAFMLATLFLLNPFAMYRHNARRVSFIIFLVCVFFIVLHFILELGRPA